MSRNDKNNEASIDSRRVCIFEGGRDNVYAVVRTTTTKMKEKPNIVLNSVDEGGIQIFVHRQGLVVSSKQ